MSQNLMPENEAIRFHLSKLPVIKGLQYFSGFIGAIGDARFATGRDGNGRKIQGKKHGSWLGAIGYMALLDQIGSCFKQKGVSAVKGNSIYRAFHYFTSLSEDEMHAIYALRCAFAHDFSLTNVNMKKMYLTHNFQVTEGGNGKLVVLPVNRWDGNYSSRNADNITIINLELLGDLVEIIYSKLVALNGNNNLEVELNGGSDELLQRYSFMTNNV